MSALNELRFNDADSQKSDWLSPEEAAEYLRIFRKDGTPSVESIRNLVSQRKIPFYKPLGRLLFKRSELHHFIEKSRKVGSFYG